VVQLLVVGRLVALLVVVQVVVLPVALLAVVPPVVGPLGDLPGQREVAPGVPEVVGALGLVVVLLVLPGPPGLVVVLPVLVGPPGLVVVLPVLVGPPGLVGALLEGFHQRGRILVFRTVQDQFVQQLVDLELLVQSQRFQPGHFRSLAQFDNLRCQLANLTLLLLHRLSGTDEFQ
jgi:hypothetical protein